MDNASAPEDVAILVKLAARVSTVDLILNTENIGYFPGLNLGIRRLRAAEPRLDYAVVGNNDLEFPTDFGRVLAAKEPEFQRYPVILPDIVTLDGVHQNPHVVGGISTLREFVYDAYYANFYLASLITQLTQVMGSLARRKDASQHAKARNVRGGIGACYVLTKAFFEEFAELAAPTFLMGEEYFLTRQLEERGLSMRYEPALIIKHRCNGALENCRAAKYGGSLRLPTRLDGHTPIGAGSGQARGRAHSSRGGAVTAKFGRAAVLRRVEARPGRRDYSPGTSTRRRRPLPGKDSGEGHHVR